MILRNDNDDSWSDEVQVRWNGGKKKREKKWKRKSRREERLDEYKRYAYTNVNMHVEFAMS